MWQDEHCNKVFYTDTVTSTGQVIAVIVGKDKKAAQKGASLVKVEYEVIEPVILTISDAIKHDTWIKPNFEISNGDIDKGFAEADHIMNGVVKIGGQEHFYFEPQCCRVTPIDNTEEIVVQSSSQWLSYIQKNCAKALGIRDHKVHSTTKRLGGAFGGKETDATWPAAITAVAAVKYNRPMRMVLERDEDMAATGTRHPSQFHYKVGFNKDGNIISYKCRQI